MDSVPGRQLVEHHFWVDAFPASVHAPDALTGFGGVCVVTAALVAAADAMLRRADVTV